MATSTVERARSWRTVDIVITAVLGVAFGVVFWAWNLLSTAVGPALAAFAPVTAVLNGVFLMPGVAAGLLVRRPGAALLASTVAATVSLLLGSPFGAIIIVYGLVQGLGAELGFLLTGYRRSNLAVALVAATTAGLSTALLDLTLYYPTWPATWMLTYVGLTVASSLVLAGVGCWLLVRALGASGALSSFDTGRRRV